MVKTFDTSRVGGGTYELEQDSSGNYKLKSVGFEQVNKLNLPDLTNLDLPATTTPVKPEEKKDIADPFKKLADQQQGGGEGVGQDYSGVMLKSPEVKDISVREAGDAMTKDAQSTRQNFDQSVKDMQAAAEQNYNKSLKDFQAAKGGSPSIVSNARTNVSNARRQVDQAYGFMDQDVTTPYQDAITRGQKGVKAASVTTGLQDVVTKGKSAVANTVSKILDNSLTVKVVKGIGTALSSIAPEKTVTQKVNESYFNVKDNGRISGNPATDVFAGMNRTSDFGNLSNAAGKRIETRTKTIERKGYKAGDKFFDDTEKMKDDKQNYDNAKNSAKEKAKSKGTTTNPNKRSGADSGGNGSDSGRVICTDLHRTGELSTRDWIRDTKFTFTTLSKKHVKGYLLWAEPTVKHMQKYPKYRKMWKHIAQHRANDIAWRLNEGKFDLLGRIYAGIGEPVCWALGNFVSDKQISKYNLTHWRRA